MPIFKLIEEQDASDEVKETYEKIKARYGGFLPDIYKAFANDPTYLESINEHMTKVLAPRKVDANTKAPMQPNGGEREHGEAHRDRLPEIVLLVVTPISAGEIGQSLRDRVGSSEEIP